ncbi:FKBP-type peptidyl-prolyl cis-trans isomerase [Wolffia australiana]
MRSVWSLSHLLTPAVPLTSPRQRQAAPPRAAAEPGGGDGEEAAPAAESDFDDRLAQMRRKYRSGSGKKAELRRAKKTSGGAAKTAAPVMLPPVALKEPVVAGGVKVELGFTPYSERLNGRLAALGLAALLLVELGSGQGLLRYHTPAVVFTQIYTVAAAAAVLVKLDKERISVWPGN